MTRPAYAVSVSSAVGGWSYTTEHGETPDPEAPVQLLDGMTLRWGWPKGGYPGQLEPSTASWSMLCATADDVPPVDPGDHVVVRVTRPTDVGPDLVWFEMVGSLGDPEVTPHPRGLQLSLTAVDIVADLAQELVPGPFYLPGKKEAPDPSGIVWEAEPLWQRVARVFRYEALHNAYLPDGLDGVVCGPLPVDRKGALDVLTTALACPVDGQVYVLRSSPVPVYDDNTFPEDFGSARIIPPAGPFPRPGGEGIAPDKLTTYFVQPISHSGDVPPVYALAAVDGVAVKVQTDSDLSQLAGLALDARVVLREPTVWRKSREDSTNQVKVIGVDDAGEEATALATYDDLATIYGANTRTVDTQLLNPTGTHAQLYLPDRASAVPGWSTDTFVVSTKGMTDDQLDGYAPKFWPQLRPIGPGNPVQLPCALVGIDAARSLTGPDLVGVLVGADLVLAGGVVTITGTMRNELLASSDTAGALSYAQLAADPDLAGTAYSAGDLVVDPDLTYRDFRLIGA